MRQTKLVGVYTKLLHPEMEIHKNCRKRNSRSYKRARKEAAKAEAKAAKKAAKNLVVAEEQEDNNNRKDDIPVVAGYESDDGDETDTPQDPNRITLEEKILEGTSTTS
jgi:hypothetical protein